MTDERWFSEKELRRFDGEDEPMYIAFDGIVYDVSDCPHWKKGLHEGLHFPGQDLSSEISNAPHGRDVFNRPCIRQVGRLTNTKEF